MNCDVIVISIRLRSMFKNYSSCLLSIITYPNPIFILKQKKITAKHLHRW